MDALRIKAQVSNSQGDGHIWPLLCSSKKLGLIEPDLEMARTCFHVSSRWHERRNAKGHCRIQSEREWIALRSAGKRSWGCRLAIGKVKFGECAVICGQPFKQQDHETNPEL